MPPAATAHTSLLIGVLGGVPPAIGGHGLELQMQRTMGGLRALGHDAIHVNDAPMGAAWDVVHAFGSEGDVQHLLAHWTRARAPLVITPVLVTSPGRSELSLRLATRWPGPRTHAAMRLRALRQAQALIAGTDYERRVLRRLLRGGPAIAVVPNGADLVVPAQRGDLEPGYALLLGAVSQRKGQLRVAEALAGTLPVVVAGSHADGREHLAQWESTVARTGATWLGHVGGAPQIARLLTDATALVHLASEEVQSLAVLEALAAGTPVVVSDIPSHRELAAAHPQWVTVLRHHRDLPGVLLGLQRGPRPSTLPAVETWTEVARQIVAVYQQLRGASEDASAHERAHRSPREGDGRQRH